MWVKRNYFLELEAPQRSPAWFEGRKNSATASKNKVAMGFDGFQTQDEYVLEIQGKTEKKEVNADMQRGIDGEDPLRQNFLKTVAPTASLYEPSLCLGLTVWDFPYRGRLLSETYGSMFTNPLHPAWFIRNSPDGIMDWNGIQFTLECKFPESLYLDLQREEPEQYWLRSKFPEFLTQEEVREAQANGYPNDHFCLSTKIKLEHFCQIYGQMAGTLIPQAIYLVGYLKPENGLYYQGLQFDNDLWQRKFYPHLIKFVVEKLIPALSPEDIAKHTKQVKELQLLTNENDYLTIAWGRK